MPVGAYGASRDIMRHIAPEGDVYQAGTLVATRWRWLPVVHNWPNVFNQFLPGPGAANGSIRRPTQPLCRRSATSVQGIQYRLHFLVCLHGREAIRSSDEIDPKSMEHFRHCTKCYWNAASTLAHRAVSRIRVLRTYGGCAVGSGRSYRSGARGGLQPLSGRVA